MQRLPLAICLSLCTALIVGFAGAATAELTVTLVQPSCDPFSAYVGDSVPFEAVAYEDGVELDDATVQWSWDFGDDAQSTDNPTCHTYTASGDYVVTVTATVGQSTGTATISGEVDAQTLTVTLEGDFYNEDTEQVEYHLWDMTQDPDEPWALVTDNEYYASVTLSDACAASVTEVWCYDPYGNLIDDETADPPVHSLTAAGWFTAAAPPMHCMAETGSFLGFSWGDIDWAGNITFDKHGHFSGGGVTFKQKAEAAPQSITIVLISGPVGDQKPVGGAMVYAWLDGHENAKVAATTSIKGEGVIQPVTPGKWWIEGAYPGNCGCHYKCGPWVVPPKVSPVYTLPVQCHSPVTGHVVLKDGAALGCVTVELMKGDQVVQTAMISPTGVNGVYGYTIGPPPSAGSYTVRGTYTGGGRFVNGSSSPQTATATVPNDCASAGLPGLVQLNPGSHSPIVVPDFTFDVQYGP